MEKVLVFGHLNPDTDSIASAISFAHLQRELGVNAEAVALGMPNEETQFALKAFGFEPLRVIEKAAPEAKEVMLVDHNERQQTVSDFEEVRVTHVVDHHRIAFECAEPLFYRAEPVGCTNTIIYKLYKENNIDIPKNIAGMMVSAIISDTLLLKSPTCTKDDIEAATALAQIAEIELESYGLDLLKAGTNLSTKSESELLNLDAKSFDMNGTIVRINQVNTVDFEDVLVRKAALEADMKQECLDNDYDLFLLLVTNILTSDSVVIALGEHTDKVEEAFTTTLEDNQALLKGVVSRKKQVVPPLTDVFNA